MSASSGKPESMSDEPRRFSFSFSSRQISCRRWAPWRSSMAFAGLGDGGDDEERVLERVEKSSFIEPSMSSE